MRITFLIDEGMCTKCIHEIRIHVENIVVLNILIWEKNEWVEIYPDEIATKLKEYQTKLRKSGDLVEPNLTEKLIKNIIINYIKEINTIVLYDHYVASDFNTNKCIKFIKNVDKNFKDSNIFERKIPINKYNPDKLISIKYKNYPFKFQPNFNDKLNNAHTFKNLDHYDNSDSCLEKKLNSKSFAYLKTEYYQNFEKKKIDIKLIEKINRRMKVIVEQEGEIEVETINMLNNENNININDNDINNDHFYIYTTK
ncbi:hypothetical protein U3516DRAFT_737363 [Neocallimastix sp. 'constans']